MRILAMKDIAWDGYLMTQPDSAFYYAQMQYDYAKKVKHEGGMADALNTQGASFYVRGELDKAIVLYTQSMVMREKQGNKQAVAASLNNIGNIHFGKGDMSKALSSYTSSLATMKELGDSRGMAVTYSNIGDVHKHLGNFEKAIASYTKSMQICLDTKDMQGVAALLDNIGMIHRDRGNLDKAMDNYLQGLRLKETLADKDGLSASYDLIALVYQDLGEYDKAMENHQHSYDLSEEFGNGLGMAISLNNMGKVYFAMGDRDKAMKHYTKSLELRKSSGELTGMSNCLNNIGNLHLQNGNKVEALRNYEQSLEAAKATGDQQEMGVALINIGKIMLADGEEKKALTNGTAALAIGLEVGDGELTRDAAELLYRTHKKLGRTSDALQMHELYATMRDSILGTDNRKEVMRHQFQYDYEKKEALLKAEQQAKDAIADARIRTQRLTIMGMAGGGFLLFGLGLLGFLLFRQQKRNETLAQSIAARDAERNRLARELHDGVAGELFGLQMAIEGNQKIDMRNELGRLRDEIRHISHDLAMPDIHSTSLPEMADYLIGRHRHTGREVVLMVQPPDDAQWNLPAEKAQHIYRMLQEGLGNALRHTAAEDLIKVRLNRNASEVNICIENPNSKVEEPTNGNGNGIGLKNLNERAELIGATVTFHLDNDKVSLEIIAPLN